MKYLLISIAIATNLLVGVFAITNTSLAAVNSDVCNGIGATGGGGGCSQSGEKSIPQLATQIINIFSWVVGVVAVIMIIYGGFRYITSGGESSGVKAAKDTILYAVIGLFIVAIAQALVRFVLKKASG